MALLQKKAKSVTFHFVNSKPAGHKGFPIISKSRKSK